MLPSRSSTSSGTKVCGLSSSSIRTARAQSAGCTISSGGTRRWASSVNGVAT